ncbi:MAG TPA: restriction endonuclease subunit S, partial [Caldilinea sp.]|nr:restriction endonuclease subunit S [Caldilinea sp.]
HNTTLYVRDFKGNHPRFISYFLKTLNYLAYSDKAAVPGVNRNHLHSAIVQIPPLPEQRAIAHILGALDDKIELNRRMNRTLEAMARALFQSWFVDFDPVRAKQRGEAPPGLAPEIAALFPDRLVEVEGRSAPEGWKVTSILNFAERLSGGTPKTSVQEYWNGDIRWVSAKDVKNSSGSFVIETERTITRAGISSSAANILPANTTVVTARGTVGSYCLLAEDMAINQTNYGLKSKLSVGGDYFVFFSLANLVAWLQQNTHGTIFDTITTDTLQQTKTFLPKPEIIAAFESVVSPLMKLMREHLYQNRTLAELRDTLLPKLMSGEVRVPEAAEWIGG